MQECRKGPVKVELITCAERFWWCLNRIKSVCLHSLKVLSSYGEAAGVATLVGQLAYFDDLESYAGGT